MSELQTQLRDYFDGVVERVDVRDVMAQAHVRNQRTLRPVWAAALGAISVTVGIGSIIAANWLLRAGPETIRPIWSSMLRSARSTPWALSILIGIAVGLAVLAAGLALLGRKGRKVDTIERTSPAVARTGGPDRRLVIVLAVALVLALAAVVWLLVAPPESSASAVPADVQTVLDDYRAAWGAHDGATAASMVGTFTSYRGEYSGAALVTMVDALYGGWKSTPTGPTTVIETPVGDTVYYTIAEPEEVTWTGGSFETMSTYRLVRHAQTGRVELLTHDTVTALNG